MIRATILAADRITACGMAARCPHELARRLIAAGYDPALPMKTAWHDGRPSMRFGSLAAAAQWTVRESPTDGPRRVRYRPPPHARAAVGGRAASAPGDASATALPGRAGA